MTITKFRVGLAALLVLGIAALFVIVGRAANSLPPGEYDLEAGQYVFNVPELGATTVPPTDIPPTPDGPIEPFAGAPLCSSHDDRAWHSLWNATEGCHYNHEHKDNPRDLDGVFGTEFYAWAGGEISYPWETFPHDGNGEDYPAPTGPKENVIKHESYGWQVYEGETCVDCVEAYRLEFHGLFGSVGAITRFHSYSLEAKFCDDVTCGTLRTGGWKDFGRLAVSGTNPDGTRRDEKVPLPNDPTSGIGGQRNHEDGTNPNINKTNFAYWSTVNDQINLSRQLNGFFFQQKDTWDYVSFDDPGLVDLKCPDFQCDQNGSKMVVDIFDIRIPSEHPGNVNGIVNFEGYIDRYGNIVADCSPVGVDCIPIEIVNAPVGDYRVRGSNIVEYDISPFFPDGTRDWWISYPN